MIARALRDAGMEVIYTGIRQTPEMIAEASLQEDVDVVAISILSGAHMELLPLIISEMKDRGIDDRLVLAGGIIPEDDIAPLKQMGVGEVFGPRYFHHRHHRLHQDPSGRGLKSGLVIPPFTSFRCQTPMPEAVHARDSLTTRILEALQKSGRPIDELTYRDLIPVSELHNRGKQATVDLTRLAEIQP